MQKSTFKIYNASAGSGKTFTLAKSYIKALIQSNNYDQFKHILAITFTNKAVGEMKERIITMLKSFSNKESLTAPNDMFIQICKETSISPQHLQTKSKYILKYILHNYGAFDISTIDGFTHRIIRTFAQDLKLPVNFEVELQEDRLLNEAVESLISKAGSDKNLTTLLIDFAIEKTDGDKSWDISFDFKKIAKLLISENDLLVIKSLEDKTQEDFNALKLGLLKDIAKLESDITTIANKILVLIEECGLEPSDFNRKSLPNYFKNLSQSNFNITFDTSWQNHLINGLPIYPKRTTEHIASTIESIRPDLVHGFTETKTKLFRLKLKKAFYRNVTPLSVLNAIKSELSTLKQEQNTILISEFNKIISAEIKNQPTPFIYERLGEKFKTYFIDEFQDTSKLQWENLVPLLDNTLSASNGSVMLVGDAKQAIYRWRGGEAEEFINLYNKVKHPFQIDAEVLNLDTNYRSAKEIVAFNNDFFSFLSKNYFSNTTYSRLYENAKQNFYNNNAGYVNIEFLDINKNDDTNEIYADAVYKTIITCYEKGYTAQDICVIVRKRKQGVTIANYLSQKNIKVTSSESLLLKNSDRVNFINSFLKLLLQPDNDALKINVLSFIANTHNIEDKHSFFDAHVKLDLPLLFTSLQNLNIFLVKEALLSLPLYELVEQLIRTFNFNDTSDAYLQFYLDVVLEYTQKQNSDLAAFIDYFENEKERLSIVSPKNTDAIQIMTIHKCKGLEFPIVIFPFADLDIYNDIEPKIWFPVNAEKFNGFETLLVSSKKDIQYFGETGEKIYTTRQSQMELDNINLLYVALTRAVNQLHIISKKDINSKGEVNNSRYSGMFISYLKAIGKWSEEKYMYSFGQLSNNSNANIITFNDLHILHLISVPKEYHNLNIITRAGQLWGTSQEKAIEHGTLVHLILSKIKTALDVDFVFNEMLANGDVSRANANELKQTVKQVIEHPKLNPLFSKEFKIFNETDIITKFGEFIRPDRININTHNEAILLDYKTGRPKAHYNTQINNYASTLNEMNYKVIHKYIVYINEIVKVIEV